MSGVDDQIDELLQHPENRVDYECALAALEYRTQSKNDCDDVDYGWTHKEYLQGHYDTWLPSPSTLIFVFKVAIGTIIVAVAMLLFGYIYSHFILGTV